MGISLTPDEQYYLAGLILTHKRIRTKIIGPYLFLQLLFLCASFGFVAFIMRVIFL